MQKYLIIILFLFYGSNLLVYSQEVRNQKFNPDNPIFFIPKNHDSKLKKITAKSFYESKSDWKHIIDSTWGSGDPLPKKLLFYNDFAQRIRNEFDGFISLQLNWDSLYNHYLNKINDSTSKGAFSSIISHFAYDLKDMHTRAYDSSVVLTPLNPGVPILLLGSYISVEHFGAVTTILPDSTTLVLRVVPNHPLNLEPGDIILGYEGIPWKNLVRELLDAGLPMVTTTGGCKSAHTYLNLIGAGLNWHLFNTIDILKHSTGIIQHLSVAPLLNLNVPYMVNNEQMPIHNIPFPNAADTVVTYGILDNTNIGYVYLSREPLETADAQFYNAINALKNTDALIIDMRLNFGGWALFANAFSILFNDFYKTIEDDYRCNINTFELCPYGEDWNLFQIDGLAPGFYDRPISVLLGPTCVSMGDITAQRLRYHSMVRFFGASSDGTLGDNKPIANYPGWFINYSISDMFHTNNPGAFLNRKEFPIDFPVWHNSDDVAIGKDAVVDKALDWINNLVYPHDILSDKTYYSPGKDTAQISTIIENPNSHTISARAYINNLNDVLIDSIDLSKQSMNGIEEKWSANFNIQQTEDTYKISVKTFDQTSSTSFTLPNAARFTTAGPLTVDSIAYNYQPTYQTCPIWPFLLNKGKILPLAKLSLKISCNDPWVRSIINPYVNFPDVQPGAVVKANQNSIIFYDSTKSPGYFNLKFEIANDGWTYWKDSVKFSPVTGIKDIESMPTEYTLFQNYPNPFNPGTTIKYGIKEKSNVKITIFNVIGEEAAILLNEEMHPGYHQVDFNAANQPSGVYFYRIQAGSFIETKKMVLLK